MGISLVVVKLYFDLLGLMLDEADGTPSAQALLILPNTSVFILPSRRFLAQIVNLLRMAFLEPLVNKNSVWLRASSVLKEHTHTSMRCHPASGYRSASDETAASFHTQRKYRCLPCKSG